MKSHTALAVVVMLIALTFTSAFAHAGTRVTDERFAGTVVAPTGAAGFATFAAGIGGFYAGGTIFDLVEPAAPDTFVDFKNYATSPLASYAFTYSGPGGARGSLDCDLPPTLGADYTCALPAGANQLVIYVFESVVTEITGTVWHVE